MMNISGKRSVQCVSSLASRLQSKSATLAIEYLHFNDGSGGSCHNNQYKTQFRSKSSLLSRPVSVKLPEEKEMNKNDATTSNGSTLPIIRLTSSPAMMDMITRSTSIRGLSSGTAGTSADLGGKRQQQSSTFRERASERAGRMRKQIKETAGHYAHQIRDTATEFREKPVEVTKQSAKTFGGMVRQYGPVFVGTYFSVYCTTLGLLFSGVHSGLLDPVSLLSFLGHGGGGDGETLTTVQYVIKFMNKYDFTRPYAPIMETYPAAANLAVAWIAIKFTEPIRLPVALALTPRVAQLIGWTGKKTENDDDRRRENNGTDKEK